MTPTPMDGIPQPKMAQAEARAKAKELGGIAVPAYRRPDGSFKIGTGAKQTERWIVVTTDRKWILHY